MTIMKQSKGQLSFRHAPLGLEPTFSHGHADALSIIFFWNNTPVLIDPGSGQYNGSPAIRNFFRSTVAHNTVEIGGVNQAATKGPFLWDKSYETGLTEGFENSPDTVEAYHTEYQRKFDLIHKRRIHWSESRKINIIDSFVDTGKPPGRGALHLGRCRTITKHGSSIEAIYNDFSLSFTFPSTVDVFVFFMVLKSRL